jgi:hypothetical protein
MNFFATKSANFFFDLLKSGNTGDAINTYLRIAEKIAKEKWLTKQFAVNQAIDILMKFYLVELK